MKQHETLEMSVRVHRSSDRTTHLQTITSVRFSVDHIQHLVLHSLAHRVSSCPVVARACSFLVHVEVLGVVDVAVWAIDDAVDYARLEIQHNRARDVARVVGLVEEDIFAVAASVRSFGGVWVKVAVLVDAVLKAQLLPEL